MMQSSNNNNENAYFSEYSLKLINEVMELYGYQLTRINDKFCIIQGDKLIGSFQTRSEKDEVTLSSIKDIPLSKISASTFEDEILGKHNHYAMIFPLEKGSSDKKSEKNHKALKELYIGIDCDFQKNPDFRRISFHIQNASTKKRELDVSASPLSLVVRDSNTKLLYNDHNSVLEGISDEYVPPYPISFPCFTYSELSLTQKYVITTNFSLRYVLFANNIRNYYLNNNGFPEYEKALGNGMVIPKQSFSDVDMYFRLSEQTNCHLERTYSTVDSICPGIIGVMKQYSDLFDRFLVGDKYQIPPVKRKEK